MNISWTAQSREVFLSLGVKTLWKKNKNKLWLIRAKRKKADHGLIVLQRTESRDLAEVSQLLWSLFVEYNSIIFASAEQPFEDGFHWSSVSTHSADGPP